MKTFKNEKFNELMQNGLELAPKMLAKHKANCEESGREYGISIEFKKWDAILNANLDSVTDEEVEEFMFKNDTGFLMQSFIASKATSHDPRENIKYITHKGVAAIIAGEYK